VFQAPTRTPNDVSHPENAAGEDAAQQEVLRMDDPEAEQPLGFRRASAGANLPSGVQAVGMEVRIAYIS
jgi:hypothetical protein